MPAKALPPPPPKAAGTGRRAKKAAAAIASDSPGAAAEAGLRAALSKDALAADGRVPFLIVKGRKGGSAMAVATVNALASEAE